MPLDIRHPIILPREHHVTQLINEDHHCNGGHVGMTNAWASLRIEYWVVRGAITIKKTLGKCISCKKRNGCAGRQIMAELLEEQLTSGNLPFYFTGVNYFGSPCIKQGRKLVKRYGCLFNCLMMRAVHIEIAPDLSSSSFINALRRFIGRYCKLRKIFSDNDTNLVGTKRASKSHG